MALAGIGDSAGIGREGATVDPLEGNANGADHVGAGVAAETTVSCGVSVDT